MVDANPLTYHTEVAAGLIKTKTVSKEITNAFLHKYGIWTVLASFLQKKFLLNLQALSTYFYNVCISRV